MEQKLTGNMMFGILLRKKFPGCWISRIEPMYGQQDR